MNKIPINQIIPFSNVDGEGNRFSIFVQKCNLNCVYCHNSETINLCCHCGECVPGCPSGALTFHNKEVIYNKDICIQCDQCIDVCRYSASPKIQYMSVEALVDEISSVKAFIRGITVSGGEPTLYHDFISELFHEVKKLGLTCYVDTNGYFSIDTIKPLIDEADGFLFDVKALKNHEQLCGKDNSTILQNLEYLLKRNKIAEVRTVVLKDIDDIDYTITKVKELIMNYSNVPYRLINTHLTGLKEEQKKRIADKILSNDEFEVLKSRFNMK